MIHRYISTYCVHDLHSDCRLTCKTCHASCLCECHDRIAGACERCGKPLGPPHHTRLASLTKPPDEWDWVCVQA